MVPIDDAAPPSPPKAPGRTAAGRYRRVLESSLGTVFSDGNQVEVLHNGVETFPAMLDAIERTRQRIEFLPFIYWHGAIADTMAHLLSRKADQGVEVRLLLDPLGARKINPEHVQRLQQAGVHLRWFRPHKKRPLDAHLHRTRRTLLICDSAVAFTGGVGIAQQWAGNAENSGQWRDTHFLLEGPAVRDLRAAFLENWVEAGGGQWDALEDFPAPRAAGGSSVMVVRSSASLDWSPTSIVVQLAVRLARRCLRITAPMLPDHDCAQLLIEAAGRGVAVSMIVPGRNHHKRVPERKAEELLGGLASGGVEVLRYHKTTLHARLFTVDGRLTVAGSLPALYRRSERYNDELAVVIDDPAVTGHLDIDFDRDRISCESHKVGSFSYGHHAHTKLNRNTHSAHDRI